MGLNFFFWKKNTILYILKGKMPFKMYKIVFFQKTRKNLGFASKFR